MENTHDTPEFELDDILNEFLSQPEEAPEGTADSPAPEQEAPAEGMEALDALLAEDAGGETAMDTMQMNELIAQLTRDFPGEAEVAPAEAEAASVTDNETIRIDELEGRFRSRQTDEIPTDETVRLSVGQEEEAEAPEAPVRPAPQPILYNPRTRLKELKKKLVAGPERRYYELSEAGVGLLQVAIVVSLVLAVLSGLVAGLYALGLLPQNRLRFVIFTQVLSLLLAALMGSHQMIEGFADLFKGRVTLNLLLSITFGVCCADAIFCLSQLRIPCCAAFSLQVTMALWAQYQRHSTEMAQMDTMRKAVRLHSLVREPNLYEGKSGMLRGQGEVEDFMDFYSRPSGPELLQGIWGIISLVVCIGIAVFAGMLHGFSVALQVLSVSLLVCVPATFFIAASRPAAILERRLHMVGTVICGWHGVKQLRGKSVFLLRDEDLFPAGSVKLNGVKFYGDRSPDDAVCYTASLVAAAGGNLVGIFRHLVESRDGREYPVKNFRDYGNGGIGGEVCNEPVLLGSLGFLQDMGVEIPQGTMVSQAVYAAIDGQLCAVYAINYAKMRSATAGLISLCGTRKISPVVVGSDFTVTESLIRSRFNVRTRRIAFPAREVRQELAARQADPEAPALALATRDDLVAYAYAVTGAQALSTATKLGVALHIAASVIGMLMMAALAYLGATDLLTPMHVLLYQLVWAVPALLISAWPRTV